MAEGIKKAAVWLGLMSDAPYAEEAHDELTEAVESHPEPQRPEPQRRESQRRESQRSEPPQRHVEVAPEFDELPASASVTELESRRPTPVKADVNRIVTVHPKTYNEARTIGEHFRDFTPVIMNLSDMEDADAKRLVDFAAGLSFGLHGTIERITSKVFLLSPRDVQVAAEDKERLAGSLFNQS